MYTRWLISFFKSLEDTKRPVLGPNVKALYLLGLWHTGKRITNVIYQIFFFYFFLFVLSQIADIYLLRHDIDQALHNFSFTALAIVTCLKYISFVLYQSHWIDLVNGISEEEVKKINKQNRTYLLVMQKYIIYSRLMTYIYWISVTISTIALNLTLLFRYLLSSSYRQNIEQGIEPYPHIFSSWFPFDDAKMPGYVFATAMHFIISIQGTTIIALYDTTTLTIMNFLKGQLCLLRIKCMEIFDRETQVNTADVMVKIIECHRHHNFLIKHFKLFDVLLSPVMFMYVLVCSLTICSSVIQITFSNNSTSQKVWVVQFIFSQLFQLIIFCWHGNEMYLESVNVDGGVFASNWWKANVRLRKQILLLAGKLNHPFVLNAGPFTTLSVPTFINILKGSYSFFTLFRRLQESH